MAHNLIVDEAFIKQEASNISQALITIDNVIIFYQAILDAVLKSGIEDGATAEALEAFSGCVKKLKGNMRKAGNDVRSLMNNYLMAIDDADKYLF